jgi:ABC-type transport system substrate-binding protein
LRTGELDFASGLSVEHADILKREGMGLDLQGPFVAGALLDTWGVDGTNVGPIADKRVRQAINYAIDRETLAKTIYRGLSEPAGYLIPPGINGHDPSIKPYTYDPARARQLLAQAGYPNGFTIDMEFIIASPETQPTVLYLQSQLKAVGIEVNLLPIEIGIFREKIYKLKPIAPIYFGGLNAGPFVDGDWLLTWFWSENKQFGKRFNNPEFDRVYVQSVQEMDPQKREALMRQAAAILQEDPGWLGLVTSYGVAGYAKTIQGLKVRPDGNPFADTIVRLK